jgi:hypothetical protein
VPLKTFSFFVDENQYYINQIEQVQDWIDILEEDENPFTEEVLEELRYNF